MLFTAAEVIQIVDLKILVNRVKASGDMFFFVEPCGDRIDRARDGAAIRKAVKAAGMSVHWSKEKRVWVIQE